MRDFIFNPNRSAENFLRGKARFLTVALTATLVFAGLFGGCKVGLGDSVDTEAPAVGILYPDPKSNAIIRDEFVLYGSCQDDKQITAVKVTLINIDSGETVLSDAPAVVDSDQKHWRIKLNSYSEDNKYNGWQFADGKYTVTVRAYDGSHDSSSDEKSSASSSFEIDNTPPVFVIKNPGVLKTGNSSPSAYGSIFTVEGTISELHSVSSMEVTVYNEAGDPVSEESYNGETLKAFVEEDIEIAGGTSVIIAQSGAADGRYGKIYGDASGTQRYTCSIKLTDNSKKYVTPPETSDNRTAEKAALGESGNSTYKIYLYDDVYDTLLSQKNEGSKKLSAGDLKNIINGTVADEEARKILLDAEKDTDSAEDATKRLYFSLNPEANPTYNVNGFEYSFDKTDSLQQASAGNAVSITVSQGLDQTQIDLDGSEKSGSTVKVWMKEYSDRPLDEGNVKEELTGTLALTVKTLEDEASGGFVEYLKATEESPVTEVEGWKLIFDYGQNNSGESSVSTKTFSVTLPAGSIALNKYYLLAVTGRDIDNVEFSQNTIYGFEGNEAGVPPTLTIDDLYADEEKTVKNLLPSSDFEFTGKATLKSSSLYTSEFMVKLTVTDQDSNKVIDTVTQTVTRSALDKGWTETAALKFSDKENWTFTPDLLGNESIKVGAETEKSYLYTLEVWGKASSGHESSSTLNVQIDSTEPKVEITSITPTVDEYNETKGPFVNGKIYVKGTVEETNLENVEIEVLVGGNVVESASNHSLGKKYSINYEIDTTTLTDNSSLAVRLIAVDKVGNRTEVSSAELSDYAGLKIDQSTDKPLIKLNNANPGVGKNDIKVDNNLFGTVSNNKLNATISDDDVIDTVKIEVTPEGSDTPIEKTENVNKSTCTISYELPKTEGVYKVKITAVDKNGIENAGYAGNAGNVVQDYFYVAVSAGAPEIELETVPEFLKTDFIISGTVSNKISKVTAEVKSAKNNDPKIYYDLKILSDKLLLTQAAGSQNWTCSLKPGETLDDAAYELLFTAKDTYGQTSSKTVKFSIDNGKPELKITQYGSNTYTEGDVSFYLIPSNEYTIKGTAKDSVTDVETVLFKVGDLVEDEVISVEGGWNTATLSTSGYWTALLTSEILSALDTTNGAKGFTFNIAAIDGAGNVSEVNKDILLYPDSDAPKISNLHSPITEFNLSNQGAGTFVISADITEAGGIDGNSIQILKDNKPIAVNPTLNGLQSSKISFEVNSVEHIVNGTNTFTLKLKDLAGNEASETLTIKSDLEAPVVEINGVSPIVTEEGTDYVNGIIKVSGIASDTAGLKEEKLTVNVKDASDNPVALGDMILPDLSGTYKNWSFNLDTRNFTDGKYTITVLAYDGAGNPSGEKSTVINVKQSTDQPVITLSNADDNKKDFNSITGDGANIFGTTSNNVLKGTITDDDGIKTVKVTVKNENGDVVKTETPVTDGQSASYTLNYPLPDTEGGYTVEITVEDTKGETDSATNKTTFVVAVDNGAPELKISTSNGGYYSGNIKVEGTVTDGSGEVELTAEYSGDGANSASGNVQRGEYGSIIDTVDISSLADNTQTGYTVTYTAKDRWGQSSTAVFKYYKDSASPVFKTDESKVANTVVNTIDVSKWFKDETLSVEAVFEEAGSGVETIYFWLDPAQDSSVVSGDFEKCSASATASNSGGKARVKTSISGFTEQEDAHILEIIAVDKAGNKSSKVSYSIKIDSTAPDFTSEFYTYDGKSFQTASGSVLSNKTKDITIYGTISDEASGVGKFSAVKINGIDVKDSVTIEFSKSELPDFANLTQEGINGLTFTNYGSIDGKTLIKSWKMVIPSEKIESGSVAITPKDTAENGSAQKIFTFEVDVTAPAVGFVTPTVTAHESNSSLNGTATITGKITEAKTPKSLEFYYSKTASDNFADYTKLGDTITDASAIYTWSQTIDFNEISEAAEAQDGSGQANIYLLVAATDLAENKNYTDGSITQSDGYVKIHVDLNGDVPTVRITNLSNKDGAYWLVGGENATIEGTLSDDDGAIKEFIISEEPITAENKSSLTSGENLNWTVGTSDFTYTPLKTNDGEKTLYFYIKDAAGGVFYTGQDNSKKFTEPKVQVKSGNADPSDAGFTYTSDGTSPVIQSIELAYSSEQAGGYSEYAAFTANTILGGNERKYVKFRITATDNNGIAKGTLKVVSETLNLTFNNTKANTWTAETDPMDLSNVTLSEGKLLDSVNVSVVVTDNSGQSGNASAVFTLDNEGPSTFSVTTPSVGTISTSDVTVSGIAQDGSGAGIKSIEFAVPSAEHKNAGNVGTANEDGVAKVKSWSDVIFGGDLKAGATAGLWSFVFAEGSNGGQLTQFTKDYNENNNTSSLIKDGYVYTIPLWFRLTDTLGNEAVYQYLIPYNPNDNWPSATVVTPKNGAILGTNADFAGTAKDNKNVDAVYIQFDLNGDGVYDSKDITKFIDNNTGVTVYSKSALTFKDPSTEKEYSTLGLTLSEKGAIKEDYTDWWGVKVSGETSWNGSFSLPETALEAENWQVRACAVDDENIAGLWSDGSATNAAGSNSVKFRVDDAAPKIGLTTLHVSNSNGTKAYSSDMYVSSKSAGEWKLVVSLEDKDSGINIGKTTVTAKTSTGATATVTGWTNKEEGNAITYEGGTYHNYNIKIPLDLSTEGTVTYTVRTYDNSRNPLSTSATYSFTVDNTAPTVNAVQFRGENLDMRKLYNTNREAEISSVVQDDISGMASLNFFFERGGKYYVPFAGVSVDSLNNSSKIWTKVDSTEKGFVLTDGIPGVTASGTGSATKNTFTIDSDVTNTDFVRAGGIIKIDGSYYNIETVIKTDSVSTVTFDGTLAKDVTSAIFPYALSVNYKTTTSESSAWSEAGTYSVGNDDGDGLVETVAKSGAKWNCTAALLSDSIADGTIVLHAVAIDAAGNVSKDVTTRTMISNHAPRLAKVHLATDLNGDGTYSTSETDAFSALYENVKTPDVSTLKTDIYEFNEKISANKNATSGKAYFKVTGDLFVAPEFVGGHEGQGSVYYDAVLDSKTESDSETAPTWDENNKLHGKLIANGEQTDDEKLKEILKEAPSITADEGNKLRYLKLAATDMKKFNSSEDNNSEDNNSEDKVGTIVLSLWDSAKVYAFTEENENGPYKTGDKVTAGTASALKTGETTLYSNFGYQWTVAKIPVYFDITDDEPPEGTITPFYWNSSTDNSLYKNSKEKGHIEFIEIPEVSGTVVFRGNARDDQILSKLTFAFDSGTTAYSTYKASTGTWSSAGNLTTDGYEFTVEDVSIGQEGHSARWTLTVDSAKLLVNGSHTLTVTATQAKTASATANNTSTPGTVQTKDKAKTGYYAMKVVPYITGIVRFDTETKLPKTTNRSRLGRYAVQEGETVTVSGFNFGTGEKAGKVQVGKIDINDTDYEWCTSDSSAKDGATSFTMKVPANSGEVDVVVTIGEIEIRSTNNTNKNDGHGTAPAGTSNSDRLNYYNREVVAGESLTTDYTDNRYLSVWALGNYFKGTDGGVELQKPVMTADKSGNLYASWVAQSNSNVMFSYGVAKDTTAIFRCFDQPATSTGVAFDKSSNNKGVNVAFVPEHQGSSGTFSAHAMSSANMVGGMGAISLGSDFLKAEKSLSGQTLTNENLTAENPLNTLDKTNNTPYYNLANYDMSRRLGSFENPRAARFGDVLHSVWYDNVNESLKYSCVSTTKKGDYEKNYGAIVGWVVLDGGFTGQDRVHEFKYLATSNYDKSNILNSQQKVHPSISKQGDDNSDDRKWFAAAKYTDNLFMTVSSYTTTSVTVVSVTGVDAHTPAVGDTIALMCNDAGNYSISIRTITKVEGTKFSWSSSEEVSHKIATATIYGGNMNVVDGDDDANDATSNFSEFSPTGQSSSAGLSADIDVTSDGLPVVAYYDAAKSKLKVAYASSTEPKLAANWSRVDTGLSCSGEVSMRVDSNGGIHIMFKDADGQLCYAYASGTSALNSMKNEVIDTNGTLAYGSLSVIESKIGDKTTVVPTVTYLNSANTASCIKYAYRTAAAGTTGEWDYQIVPSQGSGHYAVAENKISLESKKTGWTSTEPTVLTNNGKEASPATVDSVIAFKSKRFETAYLKSE